MCLFFAEGFFCVQLLYCYSIVVGCVCVCVCLYVSSADARLFRSNAKKMNGDTLCYDVFGLLFTQLFDFLIITIIDKFDACMCVCVIDEMINNIKK